MKQTFTIDESLLDSARQKVNAFMRKFIGKASDVYYDESKPYVMQDDKNELFGHSVIDITLNMSYKVQGYKFIAQLDWDDETQSNIIKASCDTVIPEKFYKRRYCDHCKSNRQRKHTVLLQSEYTGEYVQLGTACVKEYIGVDISNYISMLSKYYDLEDFMNEMHSMSVSHVAVKCFKVEDILLTTLAHCRSHRYVSKSQIDWDYDTCLPKNDSTSSIIWAMMNGRKNSLRGNYADPVISLEDWNTLGLVRSFVESLNETENNYHHNLKTVLKMNVVSPKEFGLVVSVVGYYYRDIANRQRAAQAVKSNYIGKVGERLQITGKPEKIYEYETDFGMTYVYKFIIGDDEVIWKTGKYLENAEITLKGTVKALNDYKGVKQTELTRCRIQ